MIQLKRIFFTGFLICFSMATFAQSESDLNELKEAFADVKEGKYNEAYPYFRKMLNSYPKDPTYNYFFGRCLLYLESDSEKAIEKLRFASTRNVPDDVYFYLGLAYLWNYEFEEAIANFKWFEKKASKKQARDLEVFNYKSMAQNGLYLIKYFKEQQVFSKDKAPIRAFYKNYKLSKFEGDLVDRFEYFNQVADSNTTPNVLFVPMYLENKDVLYFSAKNKRRGDYDIYRITRLTDTSWSKAENLGDKINSPFDEGFPFMHSDGSTLYFASKGHYSMGGYDLYKSSWNWERQEWTEPENLDFPINSPFDDVLFVPSPDKKRACFASNRERLEHEYTIYDVKLDLGGAYVEYKTNEQIRQVSELTVNAKEEDQIVNREKKPEKNKTSRSILKITEDDQFVGKSEYDSLLNRAISLQLKADSVKWIVDDKRIEFDNIADGHERAQFGNQIVKLEREIYTLQKEADKCYEEVRKIEQINLASKSITYENQSQSLEKKRLEPFVQKSESQNVVVEPLDNSFDKVILKSPKPETSLNANSNDWGLRVTIPSLYNSTNTIKTNEKLPGGIVYLIQLGAFSSEKSPSVFMGMEPITCIKKQNSKIHKYYAGKFLMLSDAEENLPIVKSKGFKDAYIVAFNKGKITPINVAVKLETKNANQNYLLAENKVEVAKQESNNLLIIYVIKATLNKSDLKMINEVKEFLNDNQEIYFDDSKSNDNLIIKSFISYDAANILKSKIEQIIHVEIEIHAYFAENQIPLDQARKITQ
ncbi:MAG: PD40 domain-containing protein [Bacteroidales bacterium]|nr:PD40 domain-containing protein [Bacteroidales bacterium]